jgi:Kef-type K+ transport system membrane component KefB
VGAFAAGVVMQVQMVPATTSSINDDPPITVSHLLAPLERFLAPTFFLFVGMQKTSPGIQNKILRNA